MGSRAFNATPIATITDTGGNIVLMLRSILAQYYADIKESYIQGDGTWTFPCSSILRTFNMNIGTYRIAVLSKTLIFAQLGPSYANCYGAM
ncbi:hypothetical protein BJ878DRAFT_326493 [Calycina marina]|uniref:Peptidase A1 domain-containing protein n=1 Tax=Calycina marina TaxID=1763456 RepID=A0A9P7ZC13_9HELO|nr:hypothetical protein BJ878DRAFT_326493 [Calycina marina]